MKNIVSFEIINPLSIPFITPNNSSNRDGGIRGFITVDVKFKRNVGDDRKIDVKFEACRVVLRDSQVDVKIPLGLIGPTGWLRTQYIDEDIRITRGHKGSVFILSRTSNKAIVT